MKSAIALLVISVGTIAFAEKSLQRDWLVNPIQESVRVQESASGKELILSNGLISRTFRLQPNLSTISFKNLTTGEEFVRGVKPEAAVVLDGQEYNIGGLQGQPDYGYLDPAWLESMTSDPAAFQFVNYTVGETSALFSWKRVRHCEDRPWPPKGKSVAFHFVSPSKEKENQPKWRISVHYEMYEGIPVLAKWIVIQNNAGQSVVVDRLTTEILAVVERESQSNFARTTKPRRHKNFIESNDLAAMTKLRLHVQSDYAFCGGDYRSADQTTFWEPDEQYETQVDYDRLWPHLLTCRYPYGPGAQLAPGESFTSFRTYEMLHDSDDAERRGLAVRRLHRVLTPWCTENPLMLHLRYSDSESIRWAVDQ